MAGYNFTLSKRMIEDQVYFVFVLSKGDVILEEVMITTANLSLFLKQNALTQAFFSLFPGRNIFRRLLQ